MIELRPMTPEFMEAVLDDRRAEAAEAIGASLPDRFPRDGERRFLELRLGQMRKDPRFLEWCPFVVVVDGRMVGHAGFHGPPGVNSTQKPAAVEFGYAIEPDERRRGYATAAVEELLRISEARGIRDFVLACAPDNEPSLAIIRRLGGREVGEQIDEEDGLELIFEIRR